MPPPPFTTYQRLRETIAERMRMSHIYQPLMLMELLGRSSRAPAQDVARRILGNGWRARFTFNGITAYGNGATSLIGGDELSGAERGVEVFAHLSRLQSSASTTWSNWSARAGMLLETICQMVSSSRPK
jgi:hypothetical protein